LYVLPLTTTVALEFVDVVAPAALGTSIPPNASPATAAVARILRLTDLLLAPLACLRALSDSMIRPFRLSQLVGRPVLLSAQRPEFT
jgi:hypothetical protein